MPHYPWRSESDQEKDAAAFWTLEKQQGILILAFVGAWVMTADRASLNERLIDAIVVADEEAVAAALQAGADPGCVDVWKRPMVRLCVVSAGWGGLLRDEHRAGIVRRLVAAGAPLDAPPPEDPQKAHPQLSPPAIHSAALLRLREVVETLVDLGTPVDTLDGRGWTALETVVPKNVRTDHLPSDMVQCLLGCGADPHRTTHDPTSAAQYLLAWNADLTRPWLAARDAQSLGVQLGDRSCRPTRSRL